MGPQLNHAPTRASHPSRAPAARRPAAARGQRPAASQQQPTASLPQPMARRPQRPRSQSSASWLPWQPMAMAMAMARRRQLLRLLRRHSRAAWMRRTRLPRRQLSPLRGGRLPRACRQCLSWWAWARSEPAAEPAAQAAPLRSLASSQAVLSAHAGRPQRLCRAADDRCRRQHGRPPAAAAALLAGQLAAASMQPQQVAICSQCGTPTTSVR